MKKILIIIFIFFLLPTSYSLLTASQNTGASFLNIGTSARAVSMGGAYVGVANDASAISYNPAGLSQLSKSEIIAQHTMWIADTNHDFLAYVRPTSMGTMGISVVALTQGRIEGRDENRQKTGSFSAYDTAVTVSYSKQMSGLAGKQVSLGTNLKIIQQGIAGEKATGIAMDIGLLMKQSFVLPLQYGLSIQNIGPKMTFISEGYNLPLTATVGIGYTLKRAMTFALDVKRKIYDNKTEVSFGTEYAPINLLALRIGYLLMNKSTHEHMNASNFAGFGGGLGLRITNTSTDYAFIPYGDLGNTQRISFSVKF
ncbi:MAG: PorV/PorQ family protein [Elusimicrobia bacterium]|nr:PorV/PorQ family protein [Elusimicrobiota bacterium]